MSITQNIRAQEWIKSGLYGWTISKVKLYIINLVNVYDLYTKRLMP